MFRVILSWAFITANLLIAIPESASGQVVAAYYNDEGDFGYDIQSMPDLDQKRSGVPGDGCMYCAPTAAMNLFGYAANFGYPGLAPGPGFWEGTSGHSGISLGLVALGQEMCTDEDDGTFYPDWVEGANDWIAGQELMISANARKSGFWPTIDDLAEVAVNGGLVALCYGRYDWQLINSRPFLTDRTGGHCVSLELAFADNGKLEGPRLVHYRNPSTNDSNLNSNSNYSSTNISAAENLVIATSMLDDGTTVEYIVTALNPPDGLYRIVDAYLALFPNGGAGFSDVQLNTAFVGGGLGFVQKQQPVPFVPPPGQIITSVIQHPLSHGVLALTAAPESPVQLLETRHSGRFRNLLELSEQATDLISGPGTTFFINDGGRLFSAKWERAKGQSTVSPPIAVPLPKGNVVQTGAFDFKSNTLVVAATDPINAFISISQLRANEANPNLFDPPISLRAIGIGSSQFIDSSVHNGNFFGVLSDNRIVRASLHSLDEDDDTIPFSEVNLPIVVSPIAIDFDSNGRMYVSDQQQGLLEFVLDTNGQWVFPNQMNFAGQFAPGSRFVAFRSQTNIQQGDLRAQEWRNILPKDLVPLGPDVPD